MTGAADLTALVLDFLTWLGFGATDGDVYAG
jgi:hypothetical protein